MATIDDYRKIENLGRDASELAYYAKKNLKNVKECFDSGVIISYKGFMSDEVTSCIKELGILENDLDVLSSRFGMKRKELEKQLSEDYANSQQETTQNYVTGSSIANDKKNLSSENRKEMYFTKYS